MKTTKFSRIGLERLDATLLSYVERKEMPGFVALVSHHDDVHVTVGGRLAFDREAGMQRDSIFRLASLTKVVTAVAAMILVEEGRLRLDDSIDFLLPELANRRVLRTLGSEIEDTVPANRAITVRDVLTYRMGFGSIMAAPGTYPIQGFVKDYRLGGDGPPLLSRIPSTADWIQKLSSLPLMAQPGERWMYNTSGDVLGILIARASGQSLGSFMQERIFAPLGMKDTAFSVPEAKISRLTDLYSFDHAAGALKTFDGAKNSAWASPPPMELGAAGLVSTVDDYFVFSKMLLQEGALSGTRILSPATVRLMTNDQLTPENRVGAEIFFRDDSSWGLGFAVDIRRAQVYQTPGRYGWTGGFGTSGYVDPSEGVIGILLTQRMMDSPESTQVASDFWTQAYCSIVPSEQE